MSAASVLSAASIPVCAYDIALLNRLQLSKGRRYERTASVILLTVKHLPRSRLLQLDMLADTSAPIPSQTDPKQKVLVIQARLCQEYGCPIGYFHNLDPLSELISASLSHRTKNKDSGRAFKQLRAKFSTWAAVRDANTADVQMAIAPCTWPEQKAHRIQQILKQITKEQGRLSVDFIENMPVKEARRWLETLPGVGPKTSAAVLSFSTLRRRALPVDSHHHRVATRTGLISEKVSVGPSHKILEAQLPEDWSAQQVYDNHEVLMLHGQRCCYYRNPECDRCVILDLCPFGTDVLAAAKHQPKKTPA